MFNPLKGLGDINTLRKQAQQVQRVLSEQKVEVEKDGVRVVMSGDQKIIELTVDGMKENRIADAVEEALKKTQQIAAQALMQIQRE